MLKKQYRLSRKDNIAHIIRGGDKISSRLFLCKYTKNDLPFDRAAIVISKKVEKKAVKRNKCRRRLYEALRNQLPLDSKQHYNMVFLVNTHCISSSFTDIEKEISTTLGKLESK